MGAVIAYPDSAARRCFQRDVTVWNSGDELVVVEAVAFQTREEFVVVPMLSVPFHIGTAIDRPCFASSEDVLHSVPTHQSLVVWSSVGYVSRIQSVPSAHQ